MLGLIRPTAGIGAAVRPRPAGRASRALEGVAGFVEAPRFYPYLTAARTSSCSPRSTAAAPRARIDEVLDDRRAAPTAPRTGSAATRTACASAWASPRRCCARPRCCCSTSPRPASTPAGMRDMRALIRRLADEGMTVLLSSHLLAEVEELCNRVAIVRTGASSTRARSPSCGARPAPATGCAPPTTSARWRSAAAQPGIEDVARRRPTAASPSAPTSEEAVGELSLALAEAGALILELSAATRRRSRTSSSALTEGDGAAAAPNAGRPRAEERGMMPGVLDRLPLGAAQAALPEAHLPRPRRRGARADHLRRRRSRPQSGEPDDVAFGRYVHDTGPGDPAGAAAVRLDLDVPADHRAGRRRHRRRRGPQRHAEDDPHPLGRAPAGLRRQGARRRHLRDRRDRRSPAPSRSSPGCSPPGFNPIVDACPARASRRPTALALVGASLLVYLIPILAIACIGLLLLDRLPQQRRGDRRHADVLAAAPADRRSCPGLGGLQPYLLQHAVQRLAGPAARRRSTGRRSCAPPGSARSTRCPRWSPRCLVFLRRDVAGRLSAVAERVLVVDDDRRCGGCSSAASPPRASRSRVAADGGARAGGGRALGARPGRARRDDARRSTGSAVCRRLRAKGLRGADPDADRARRGRRPRRAGSRPAPTTTWSSRSRSRSWWRACTR